MSIEAMKQALEALDCIHSPLYVREIEKIGKATVALRAAIEQTNNKIGDEDQLIFSAWRDSEAYQVPMTEEGVKLAGRRFETFRKGWEYHKFYLEHGDVYMKDYLEHGPRCEDE
jgi:hypothetical protein